jgi:hypothetical protein
MSGDFVRELEIFRTEQEVAQQYFFGYLAIRKKAEEDRELLGVVNLYPWFWVTVDHSLLLGTFMALGRIFDRSTQHNIGTLMSAVSAELSEFSRAALKARHIHSGLSVQDAAKHVSRAHELTAKNVKELEEKVEVWRGVYDNNYREIRNKVFAHKVISTTDKIDALFEKTTATQLKALLHFLNCVYLTLWEAYSNGVAFNFNDHNPEQFVGKRVRRDAEKVLNLIVEGARAAR